MIRIYVPVWGSLIFALAMAWAIPRAAASELSSWVNLHDEPPHVLSDAFLLQGTGQLNSPLWSLQYEMLFSLLLPLYLIALIRFRKLWLFPLIGLVTLIAAGNILYLALPVYMPMFGIGVLMAVHRETLESWGRELGGWMWAGLLVVSIILLCSRWLFPQLPVVISMAAVGGALLIFAVIACQPMKSFADNHLIRWLGVRSFSLYLIHEPIVLSVTFALRSNDAVQVALLAVPLSLLVTELFFRFVEHPSHRLASAAGQFLSSGLVSRKSTSISVS
jgi:peptidoglycan/LPS O-acetylase OafA/YrhL